VGRTRARTVLQAGSRADDVDALRLISMVTESLATYGDTFPGEPPVDLHYVAQAYVRSIGAR
jgi:hypothetical protein